MLFIERSSHGLLAHPIDITIFNQFTLAAQLQAKAEANDDRDTAVMAYAVQRACSVLEESRREFTAANATIHNLELQLADAEARGVDKFATEIGSVYKQLRPGSNHAQALKSVVLRAVEFAAQLRQGAAQ